MERSRLVPRSRVALAILVMVLAGCEASPRRPASDEPADAGPRDRPDSQRAPTPEADAGGAAGEPATCDEMRAPRAGARPIVTVTVELTHGGKPVTFGEPFSPGASTGSFTLTNFRFYVSELAVLGAGGAPTPVDLVAQGGAPVPYNVHLVNAEETAGLTFRLAVPAGDYGGLSFLLGMTDACNRRDPGSSRPPLTHSSQMTWPPPFGFLFLRSEAKSFALVDDAIPLEIHAGGMPGILRAPRVTAGGPVRVGTDGASLRLRVALDELFRAATLPADTSMITSPDEAVRLGEHVRHNAPMVPIFTVTP